MIPNRALPPSWSWVSFKEVATVASNLVDPVKYQDLPHIAPNHIESRTGRLLPYATVAEDGVTSAKHLFHCGQILYSKIRPYLAKAIEAPFEGLCSADMYPIDTVLVPRFLLYWLLTSEFTHLASQVQGRTVLPKINRDQLDALPVPVAPPNEQQRIVGSIEEQFSRLDTGVLTTQHARQNLKRMRAAVLESAVRGRLFKNPSGTFNPVGHRRELELPTGWSITSVGDIAEVSGGITKNPKRRPANNPIPFLRVANVLRDQLDLREVHNIEVFAGELERLRLQRGDLLVVEGNGSSDQIGRSALWDASIDPCVHQNHVIRIRPGNTILAEYLNIFWNAPSSMATIQAAASSTSGLHTLSTGKVRRIRVTLPPVPEQHRIIEDVDRQLSALNALDQQVAIAEMRERTLRAAILAAAFAGNLVSQDLSDEPASHLLERITAERAPSNGHRPTANRKT